MVGGSWKATRSRSALAWGAVALLAALAGCGQVSGTSSPAASGVPTAPWVSAAVSGAASGGPSPSSQAPSGVPSLSNRAIEYARSLGGTPHQGRTLYLVVGASTDSEEAAQGALDAAVPRFGDLQSYFVVQRSDNFDGLRPGWWVVIEAYRDQPSVENLDFGRRGFPDAYVKRVVVSTTDPIPVVEELLAGG